jgi:malonate transporter and related proteins
LAGLSLKGLAGDIGLIVLGKLLLHPLAVFAMLSFLSFDPTLKQAAIINASMPMATIYPLLAQKYGQEGLCAAALVATTVVSFFTISGLLWLTHAG